MSKFTKAKLNKLEEVYKKVSAFNFTVVDIETTGLSPAKGGFLLEIGAIKVKEGKIIGRFSELIKPEAKIGKKVIELTGITNEMVEEKQAWGPVLHRFLDFLGDDVVVGHNVMFDYDRFIQHYALALGRKLVNESVCTKKFFKLLNPDEKVLTLANMCDHYGVTIKNHHRAIDDVEATLECLIEMLDQELYDVAVEQDWEKVDEFITTNPVPEKFIVTRASPWEKKVGKKHFRRIYVGITQNWNDYYNVYFDLEQMTWMNKDFNGSIEWNSIERAMLTKLQVQSILDIDEVVFGYTGSQVA